MNSVRRAPAALLLAATLLAGCAVRGKDQGLVIFRRLEGEPKTLNPLLITADPDQVVLALISRNLLDYDEKLNLTPGLAESVEDDTSHLVYTVRLRADARWEDGQPVTSEDVAYTITTLMDPKTPSLNRRGFFEGLDRVDVMDARTAKVVFRFPYANRRDAFFLPLLPAAAYRGTDVNTNPRNRSPLANGPFRLAAWESGRSIELVRNTQYFGEKAPAEKVVFRIVPESAPAFQALFTGDLDESRLNFQQYEKVREEEKRPEGRLRTLTYDEIAYTYIGWNNRSPLFRDAAVRRALTMLIDRETIARTLYGGLAKPANGPIPPGLWSYDPTLAPWPYDPRAAEAALDAAGYRKGSDGVRRRGKERFAFELAVGVGSERNRQIAELVQQAYRKAGIEMAIRPLEWGTFIAKSDAGELEASLLAFNLDPNPDLAPNWHSSQIPPTGFNSCFYVNPEADRLMDEVKTTFDRAKAKELYARLQRLIHEDEPVSFLHTVSITWATNRRLQGVRTSAIGLSLFWPGAAAWRPVRAKSPA